MKTMKTIITRHKALVEFLKEIGLVQEGEYELISHAAPKDVEDKDVIGVLPLNLAALANSITEVPLKLTPEMRGRELSIDEIRAIAGKPVTYKVKAVL